MIIGHAVSIWLLHLNSNTLPFIKVPQNVSESFQSELWNCVVMPSRPVHLWESYFFNLQHIANNHVFSSVYVSFNRCNVDNKVSRVAWLNRTTILFTGNEKWSLDPRVVLLNTAVTEYSIKILNVNLYDEGPYVCSILTNKKPESTKVHLIVQGKS